MNFRHRLPDVWIAKVSDMEEFANGATQVTIKIKSGAVITGVLISNSTNIVAVRGRKELPFRMDDIENIYQLDDDRNPTVRGGWNFWDEWK